MLISIRIPKEKNRRIWGRVRLKQDPHPARQLLLCNTVIALCLAAREHSNIEWAAVVKGCPPHLRSKPTRWNQDRLFGWGRDGTALSSFPLPSADPSHQLFAGRVPPRRYQNCSSSSQALGHLPVPLTLRNNKWVGHCWWKAAFCTVSCQK